MMKVLRIKIYDRYGNQIELTAKESALTYNGQTEQSVTDPADATTIDGDRDTEGDTDQQTAPDNDPQRAATLLADKPTEGAGVRNNYEPNQQISQSRAAESIATAARTEQQASAEPTFRPDLRSVATPFEQQSAQVTEQSSRTTVAEDWEWTFAPAATVWQTEPAANRSTPTQIRTGAERSDRVNTGESTTQTDQSDAIAEAICAALAKIKVYVVESEITDAQNSVRATVEQAKF